MIDLCRKTKDIASEALKSGDAATLHRLFEEKNELAQHLILQDDKKSGVDPVTALRDIALAAIQLARDVAINGQHRD